MSSESSRGFAIDRIGVGLIVVVAIVIAPATMLISVWMLTHGLELSATTSFELIMAALTILLAAYVIYLAARELGGGLGVRIDEHGVGKGAMTLRWDEVERLDAPAFGLLDISGGGKTLRLRTYLYDNRIELLEYIARQTGKSVPELGHSF